MDTNQILTLLIFLSVYVGIALRNILRLEIPIWNLMLIGAVTTVATGLLSIEEAYSAINMDVLIFLFSMFAIVTSLEVSGILDYFTNWLIINSRKPENVILFILLGIGFVSALLMNDTLALMGAPIMLQLSKKMNIEPKVLLITLAFSVTIGSMMTPMGNPQNLLIALMSGVKAPLIVFTYYLFLPTVVNLIITYYIIKFFYSKELVKARKNFNEIVKAEIELRNFLIKDSNLAKLAIIISALTFSAIFLVNILEMFGIKILNISWVSLIGASMLLSITKKRRELIAKLDWSILILFASMFILMEAVFKSGILNSIAPISYSLPSIVITSIALSQLISNVPMVSLYLPVMKNYFSSEDVKAWVALAGSSTIAGNLSFLGAASNLIIVEEAEKRGYKMDFFEFLKIGSIVTLINAIVLILFLYLIP